MKRRHRTLSVEDARLWASVARSAVPLKGKSHPQMPPEDAPAAPIAPAPVGRKGSKAAAPALPAPIQQPPPQPRLTQHPIERPTRRKISKGRLPIEARIDLHEMTQGVAHDALVSFLRQSQAMGLRHVLVITGRGGSGGHFGSRGVLRRVVPMWFGSPEFRPLVSGFDSAERHHGGDGALYVRVRRFG